MFCFKNRAVILGTGDPLRCLRTSGANRATVMATRDPATQSPDDAQ